MAQFTVTIKNKKELLKEVTIKAKDSEEANEWARRQAKELGCDTPQVVVVEA